MGCRDEKSLSKLDLIDLAGSGHSEAATGHCGDRFEEGRSINKSLLALGPGRLVGALAWEFCVQGARVQSQL